jgi:hypothetical protein
MKTNGKYSALNIEELWEIFSDNLNALTEKWIPSKKTSIRDHLPCAKRLT